MDEEIKKTAKPRRDDAAIAFRRYARLGFDKNKIKVFEAYSLIRGVSKSDEDAFKLLGVYDTMRLLSLTDPESADAVRAVYFADRGRSPSANQIGMRVLRYATEHNCDQRTVYRRLRSAKELYYYLISY